MLTARFPTRRRIFDDRAAPVEVVARQPDEARALRLAVLAVTAAQLLDLGTFVRMVRIHGGGVEANPIVAAIFSDFGLPFVAVTKIAALSLIVAVIVVLASTDRPSNRVLAATVAVFGVVAGVIGGLSNALVIL